MSETSVFLFQEDDGSVPVLDWMNSFREKNERAYRKCFGLSQLLEQFGHELRRPRADMLRDGVYELRTRVGNVNYRILYGFIGKDIAIERAIARIAKYKTNPEAHSFRLIEGD